METPRTTPVRISSRAPMTSQVRQNCFKNRMFSPGDSGLGSSPATGTPYNIHTETLPGVRFRRTTRPCSPGETLGRAVQEEIRNSTSTVESWKKFWLIWVGLLTVSSGLVAVTWTYFPDHKVVQKSQEYVMIGLLSIIGLIISTIVMKLTWNSVLFVQKPGNTDEMNSTYDHSPENDFTADLDGGNVEYGTPYDMEEKPTYLTPDPHCPVKNGQGPMVVESPGQNPECLGRPFFSNQANGNKIAINDQPVDDVQGKVQPTSEYPVRRTFSGANNDVWNEFVQYFENLAELNAWHNEKSRRVLLSTLRGQAETYAYGMPLVIQRDYNRLKQKMEERFGHSAMKERYVTEAKLRKRQPCESLRDFGQAIEDLFRRAYPGNPEIVEENSIKAFLDKCGQSEDFRLAVKRTRPSTLQEAVVNAMQEECLRAGEKDLAKEVKPAQRLVYEVGERGNNEVVATEATGASNNGFSRLEVRENRNINDSPNIFPRYNGGPQWRPYYRDLRRGRGRHPTLRNRQQNFRTQEGSRRDFENKALN